MIELYAGTQILIHSAVIALAFLCIIVMWGGWMSGQPDAGMGVAIVMLMLAALIMGINIIVTGGF